MNELFNSLNVYSNQLDETFEEVPTCQIMLGTAAVTLVAYQAFQWYRSLTWDSVKRKVLKTVIKLPIIKGIVEKKIQKEKDKLEASHNKKNVNKGPTFRELPDTGLSAEEVRHIFSERLGQVKLDPRSGKISGTIYYQNDDLLELQQYASSLSLQSNQLHADVMSPFIRMEAEVISMVKGLYHGDDDVCGIMTSGGTDSIIHACYACREYKNKANPEIVVPLSAHASFEKAAKMFKIKLRKIPLDPETLQVDMKKFRKAINRNTIMIVGSAPSYPYGIVDPIEELSELAVEKNIPLHVDCCLGGPIAVRAAELGSIPIFDFILPGVTTMSADTHKYFMATKGSSVLLYRNDELRRKQQFYHTDWTGGVYATPSIPGSRPGAPIAAAWVTLIGIGKVGYDVSADRIISLRSDLQKIINRIPELEVMGDPKLSVVAFKAKPGTVNIYNVADKLAAKGWEFNCLQNPSSVHFAATAAHLEKEDFLMLFESELLDSISEVKKMMKEDPKYRGSTAKLYSSSDSLPLMFMDELAGYYWQIQYRI